ncbi:hypothetical protein EVAR_5749_1 [Eumeta japonica]|uniref:Uncharacterized protein n=1 Tax=Eumeta variegata TaxID=151549 RepID=A0A4C1T6Y1_EUMVA|nr:hypothetical protein EVAR_5749_1 [Eumeta japonica]
MRWLVCVLAIWIGPVPSTNAVTVRTPPKTPGAATVQAQSKFFQNDRVADETVKNSSDRRSCRLNLLYRDFFSVQLSPYNIEFGHVCEDPNTWEQRYEKKDFKNHRDMGKVTITEFQKL